MASRPQGDAAAARRPAADLIEAVLENMRTNLEPLKYSTLAPSRYVVYLHPDEFARIEPIVPILHWIAAKQSVVPPGDHALGADVQSFRYFFECQ